MSYQFDRNSIIPRYKLVAFIIMGIGLLILGKALYTGRLNLKTVIGAVQD